MTPTEVLPLTASYSNPDSYRTMCGDSEQVPGRKYSFNMRTLLHEAPAPGRQAGREAPRRRGK